MIYNKILLKIYPSKMKNKVIIIPDNKQKKDNL